MKADKFLLKEKVWERVYDEIDTKHGVICVIGSDYTNHEVTDSILALASTDAKSIFVKREEARNKSEGSLVIFSRRPLKRKIAKALGRFYNANFSDDNEALVERQVLRTLLGKSRYAKLVKTGK